MCARSQPAPPPPPEIKLPPTPQMPNIVAPTITQSAPAAPREAAPTGARRGKRGLTIQLASSGGTKIPGM